MRTLTGMMAAFLLALPAAAAAQYETPVNPPDPADQLAEMVEIYDTICLRTFPDDDAVDQAMAARGAVPLSEAQVRGFLHDDPGRGWQIAGRTAPFTLTIEAPPYHACGLRTMAVAAFPDMSPYRALADRYEAGGGYETFGPQSAEIGDVRTTGAGEMRQRGRVTETLLVFLTTPTERVRDAAHSAVEIRFVHQIRRGR